jgi:hypothetical protein
MRNAMHAIRPAIERLRADLYDRELWCLCIIAALLWLAS